MTQPRIGNVRPLLTPTHLHSRTELLQRPSPAPKSPGVYAWYFRTTPPGVPTDGCITHANHTLLYVGIAPSRPPANGRPASRQSLRTRLRTHVRGNASSSTLRLSLGALLATELGLILQRTGRTERLTFAEGELTLSHWMQENARVCWLETPAPWLLEDELIGSLSLPLNLRGNSAHPFHKKLSQTRREARNHARDLPV